MSPLDQRASAMVFVPVSSSSPSPLLTNRPAPLMLPAHVSGCSATLTPPPAPSTMMLRLIDVAAGCYGISDRAAVQRDRGAVPHLLMSAAVLNRKTPPATNVPPE